MNDSSNDTSNTGIVYQTTRIIDGKEVILDRDGFLWFPEAWTEGAAEAFAKEFGIEKLNDFQWRVIRFLREYYAYHGRAPLNRDLKAGLGMSLMELESLFPGGIRHGARKVAGLPNPKKCSG